ncbi:Synaptic vesicle glycoprotein [Phytophthora palmivora]|uniref:Synaptic vesicle glycoprotein n=1 Tax=Phytophthora palmivora TaxID=4796 RepID=A0A2P4Y0U4_9STRA|nr:Synaptic vesicle glycoprotein [Phytophthora palmivora]
MGFCMTHEAAPVKTWGSPDEQLVLVDDVKALKQAVHDEMELIGCGFHQHRVVTVLGFGNVADAVEILAIGYILTCLLGCWLEG